MPSRRTIPALDLEIISPAELPLHDGSRGPGPPRQPEPPGGGGDPNRDDRQPRPAPQGVFRIAVWAAVISVAVLFTTLASAYLAHSRKPAVWPPIPLPGNLWFSTALIAACSAAIETARQMLRRKPQAAFLALCLTALFGAGFLRSQIAAWRQLAAQGVFLASDAHAAYLYLFTGIHGLHLFIGLIALTALIVEMKLLRREQRRIAELTSAVTLYWHLMGGLWVALFALLLHG